MAEFSRSLAFSLDKIRLQVTLKEEQVLAVKAVYLSKDVFVCLPTGYGKSVCYQVLPFLMDHKHNRPEGTSAILVVSPLLALWRIR